MKQVKFIIATFFTLYSALLFGQVTDIDGNIYQTKLFGKKLWMIENMRVTRLNNGDSIPLILNNQEWADLKSPGYCYFENQSGNINQFGCLYNGYVVDTNVCPIGWHAPNEKDWEELSREFKNVSINDALKILGHRRDMQGQYYTFDTNNLFEGSGPWWCSSKSKEIGWNRFLDYMCLFYRDRDYRNNGISIRCVKD